MLPKAQPAWFAIADISGYTSFLAAVELDHAQDIIAAAFGRLRRASAGPASRWAISISSSLSITAKW
jgi:hypothetical protein